MNVGELRDLLTDFPDDMPIYAPREISAVATVVGPVAPGVVLVGPGRYGALEVEPYDPSGPAHYALVF